MISAPYAADTRSKGWRFELDHERIRQSDTWALAGPELRPWLLMTWLVAWEQTPCGSLPNDDALIAVRIGMQPKAFAKVRDTIMRGWLLADDGRLYHPVISERVLSMLAMKHGEAKRKADYRAKLAAAASRVGPAVVPVVSHGTPAGLPPDGATGTRTGTRTGRKDEAPSTTVASVAESAPTRARASKMVPDTFLVDGELQRWARENTPLVDIRAETALFRANTFKTARSDWRRTWQGWMLREQKRLAELAARDAARGRGAAASGQTFRERDEELARQQIAALAPGAAAKPRDTFTGETIDADLRTVPDLLG